MTSINLEHLKSSLTLINHTNIDNYINQYVIVHGKVLGVNNCTMTLLIDEKGNHELLVNGFNKDIQAGEYVSIIGKVEADKSIEYVDIFPLNIDFDLEYVNEIIPLSTLPTTKYLFEKCYD